MIIYFDKISGNSLIGNITWKHDNSVRNAIILLETNFPISARTFEVRSFQFYFELSNLKVFNVSFFQLFFPSTSFAVKGYVSHFQNEICRCFQLIYRISKLRFQIHYRPKFRNVSPSCQHYNLLGSGSLLRLRRC